MLSSSADLDVLQQAELAFAARVVSSMNGLFYCGDSCQTIARGVGFRFADIRTMFYDEAERIKVMLMLSCSNANSMRCWCN